MLSFSLSCAVMYGQREQFSLPLLPTPVVSSARHDVLWLHEFRKAQE